MSCLARPVPHRYGWNEGGEKKLNGKTLKNAWHVTSNLSAKGPTTKPAGQERPERP